MLSKNREISIDALRGLAIIGMVFSGTIIQSDKLPGWMYHVQVGPPDFKFHPEVAGISWVDLVFPFFLFTMGLALPFALNSMVSIHKINYKSVIKKLIIRAFNLFVFAIMIPHLGPYGLPDSLGIFRWLFTIMGFVAFMLTFTSFPKTNRYGNYINVSGYLLLVILILIRYFQFKASFSMNKNDVIILVLANMALISAGIWIVTKKNWWTRIAVMVLFVSIWLTSSISGSFNSMLFHFTPLKYMGNQLPEFSKWLLTFGLDTSKTIFYSMYFMKYLCIVIPGTIIGDLLYVIFKKDEKIASSKSKYGLNLFAIILVSFMFINLFGLYTRQVQLTLFLTLGLIVLVKLLFRKQWVSVSKNANSWLNWSFFWLVLGLLLEPYEGGIKKDPSTLSYFFVTSGLAGLVLFSLKLAFNNFNFKALFYFLPMVGKNPMVGYVAVNFLIIPLMAVFGLLEVFEKFSHFNSFTSVFRGFILTSLMIAITIITVKFKLFWKT